MVARGRSGDGRAAETGASGRKPPGGATPRATPTSGPATASRPTPGALSRRSSPLARQASRSPPSAYKIRNSAARPGGPNRSRVTRTSVRCPTTSRPSRIQARRLSSNLSAATWARVPARAEGRLGGSRTSSWTPARRASAANRPKRSARFDAEIPATKGLVGRSSSNRSTVRSWRSIAAIASASSSESGVRTTSHSS